MTEPIRNPNNTVISVSMSRQMLAEIDERAKALGLSRSQYLCQLAREDLIARGDLTLRESPKVQGMDAPKPVGVRELTKYPPMKRK